MTSAETTSLTDGHGRTWVEDPPLHSFAYDDGHALMLRSLDQIQVQFGLAVNGPPSGRHSDTVAAPTEVHNRDEDATQVMQAAVDEPERQAS